MLQIRWEPVNYVTVQLIIHFDRSVFCTAPHCEAVENGDRHSRKIADDRICRRKSASNETGVPSFPGDNLFTASVEYTSGEKGATQQEYENSWRRI